MTPNEGTTFSARAADDEQIDARLWMELFKPRYRFRAVSGELPAGRGQQLLGQLPQLAPRHWRRGGSL